MIGWLGVSLIGSLVLGSLLGRVSVWGLCRCRFAGTLGSLLGIFDKKYDPRRKKAQGTLLLDCLPVETPASTTSTCDGRGQYLRPPPKALRSSVSTAYQKTPKRCFCMAFWLESLGE